MKQSKLHGKSVCNRPGTQIYVHIIISVISIRFAECLPSVLLVIIRQTTQDLMFPLAYSVGRSRFATTVSHHIPMLRAPLHPCRGAWRWGQNHRCSLGPQNQMGNWQDGPFFFFWGGGGISPRASQKPKLTFAVAFRLCQQRYTAFNIRPLTRAAHGMFGRLAFQQIYSRNTMLSINDCGSQRTVWCNRFKFNNIMTAMRCSVWNS